MPSQLPFRARPVLACALAVTGLVLAAAGCSHVTPLGPDPSPQSLPPVRHLGSPIVVQVMRIVPSTATGQCPAGSVHTSGAGPAVQVVGPPRVVQVRIVHGQERTITPSPTATAPPPGWPRVACYQPVGRPVTVTSAAVSSVATYPHQPGRVSYGFVVAFPAADVPALTAEVHRAYDSGDALGTSIAGKLWEAPQPSIRFIALRAEQINLLSRSQAVRLRRLLIPSS